MANSMGKSLRGRNDCEDALLGMEAFLQKHTRAPEEMLDTDVDIMKCTNIKDNRRIEADDPEATECSSSFGGTESERENCSGLSEAEVESQFYNSEIASEFGAQNGVFQMRKKKLTTHWRNFIRPLMWRCKWTELRIQQIESQALKYDRELAAYSQGKPLQQDQFALENFGSKSLPFASAYQRKKAMKRRRRKRVEEVTDITSYMLHHNLFSYFENKGSELDGASTADEFVNPDVDQRGTTRSDEFETYNDLSFLEFKEGDNSLEHVLWKIEHLQSQVHRMKNHADDLVSKNAGMFSSSETLSLLAPPEALTSSPQSPTFSTGNGETISMGAICPLIQDMIQQNNGELVRDGAVSSYGEAIDVPDIIESSVGMLFSADVTLHPPQIGDGNEAIVDNLPINDDDAELERDVSRKTSNQSAENHRELRNGEKEENPDPPAPVPELVIEPEPSATKALSQEQSNLRSSLVLDLQVPKTKRKRGERKAGSGGWSKRCSGEPESG